jgi:hypothetical protein
MTIRQSITPRLEIADAVSLTAVFPREVMERLSNLLARQQHGVSLRLRPGRLKRVPQAHHRLLGDIARAFVPSHTGEVWEEPDGQP